MVTKGGNDHMIENELSRFDQKTKIANFEK